MDHNTPGSQQQIDLPNQQPNLNLITQVTNINETGKPI